MNILNKLTIKHLKMNKRRTIVSIIGILLSTALMCGIGLLVSTLRTTLIDQTIKDYGAHHVTFKDVSISSLNIIEKNKSIKKYDYKELLGISKIDDDSTYPNYIYVNAINNNLLEDLTITEGRLPKSSNEIVLTIKNIGNTEYKIGDTITLSYGERYYDGEILSEDAYSTFPTEEFILNNKIETYKIVGFVQDSYYLKHYSSAGDGYTLIDINKLNEVNVFLTYKNIYDSYELSEVISKQIDYNEMEYNDSLLGMYGMSGYANMDAFIVEFMCLFLGIISVACIIVIYNSFAISVMERKKQFGLFASIGATKKQIMKSVMFEAFIVGSIGIILGIISAYIGIGTTILVINNLFKDIFDLTFKLTTYPLFMIVPIIFMILVILISAILPARRASRISPISVIRQNDDIKINKRKIRTSKLTKKLFGVEGELALKNIKRNKKKYRITIVSLFISIVTFIAFSSYVEYGIKTSREYIDTVNYDIEIYTYEENTFDKAMELVHLDGVDDYLGLRIYNIEMKNIKQKNYDKDYYNHMFRYIDEYDQKMTNVLYFVTFDEKNYKEYIADLKLNYGDLVMYNKLHHTVYTEDGIKKYNFNIYNPNETLSFDLCYRTNEALGDACSEYKNLSGFTLTDKKPDMMNVDYASSGILIVSPKMFEELIHEYEDISNSSSSWADYVYIKSNDYDKIEEVATINSNYYSYYNVIEEYKMMNSLILAIEILLYGFIILVTLIGVTSVFNTINTSINLRRKEFSVLRSIGLTPQGFNRMIWYESLIFAVKSLLYGLPVGILLSYIIHSQMLNLVEFSYTPPLNAILICVIAVFIIVLVTMMYATSKIKCENILDSIRNENI